MHTVCMYVLRVHWRFFNPVMLWRLFAPWLKTGVAAGEGLGAIVLRTAEGGGWRRRYRLPRIRSCSVVVDRERGDVGQPPNARRFCRSSLRQALS